MIKNTFDKIWENCKKNRTAVLLLCVFCCVALIVNSRQIAQEVAVLQGNAVSEENAEDETELWTESETEYETECETEQETESEEMRLLKEEAAKREYRRILSLYGTEFRIPMKQRRTKYSEGTDGNRHQDRTEDTERILVEYRESAEFARKYRPVSWQVLNRQELRGYEILSLDFLISQNLLPSDVDPEQITIPGVKSFGQLKRLVEKEIAEYDGDWSVYVKNLSTDESFVLNDQPMKSASVMKLFIMGTVYKAFETGELERTDQTMELMHAMISYSDNPSSNELLYLLGNGSYEEGIAKVDAFIEAYGFSDMTVEYNGFNNPATNTSDKLYNQVAAKDCGKLLEDIYRRTWVNRAVSNEMEKMLLSQNTRYKIPAGLPDGILVGNKTGEMDTTENDAAIIYGPECDYILVVLSSDWSSKDEAIFRIRDISSLVYEYLNE